jgi:hypothetical protein
MGVRQVQLSGRQFAARQMRPRVERISGQRSIGRTGVCGRGCLRTVVAEQVGRALPYLRGRMVRMVRTAGLGEDLAE